MKPLHITAVCLLYVGRCKHRTKQLTSEQVAAEKALLESNHTEPEKPGAALVSENAVLDWPGSSMGVCS